ncbi:hypothetical protein AB8810_20385 [Xanthomonas sp. NCPPB 3005]|uniref:hypothetical protein n=1 Tax=Xanthomonas sp. NCPPB 3005 TaxID=3240913 RepID=UPI003518ECC4
MQDKRLKSLKSLARLKALGKQQQADALRLAAASEHGARVRKVEADTTVASISEWKRKTDAAGGLRVALYAEAIVAESLAQSHCDAVAEALLAVQWELALGQQEYRRAAAAHEAVQRRVDAARRSALLARERCAHEESVALWASARGIA